MTPTDHGGWPLEKVISGGQTGADQGGLRAARYLHIPTGGTAPFKYMTERGYEPELLMSYGLVESAVSSYKSRTYKNIMDSEGTVIFADLPLSGGSFQTETMCVGNHKPYVVNPTARHLRDWIYQTKIRVLNVAGNRESKHPGMEEDVYQILIVGLLPF